MDSLRNTIERCQRTAIIGQLLQTIPDRADRISVVDGMQRGGVISPTTRDLLLEYYCMEVV